MIIAFIGLGNMGGGMAANLAKEHAVKAFDLSDVALANAVEAGCAKADTIGAAVIGADVVVTMLPAGQHVRTVYEDVFANATPGTLMIDCSTVDVDSARAVIGQATDAGFDMIDAPVSGGVKGAAEGTLTFMCGGTADAYARAKPILEVMGKNVFHAGDAGNGQVGKICNNMLLAILMAGTSEALQMGIDNGLDPKVMSDIMLQSSGRNWTLELYNPCPGVMPNVPSSNDYQGGFLVDLMNKDLGLAMSTAANNESVVPLGQLAKSIFQMHGNAGNGRLDFSSVFNAYKHG